MAYLSIKEREFREKYYSLRSKSYEIIGKGGDVVAYYIIKSDFKGLPVDERKSAKVSADEEKPRYGREIGWRD